MIEAVITEERRHWNPFRRRRFRVSLPESWDDLAQPRRRALWWRWALTLPPAGAARAMVRDCLRRLPRRIRKRLTLLDMAGFSSALAWVKAEPDCLAVPVASWTVGGTAYHLPKAQGFNVTCLEFALADDFYQRFLDDKSEATLRSLVATLLREGDADPESVLRRGDVRAPLYSLDEVAARAERLKKLPAEAHLATLLYFAGLKAYVHRLYGTWLFDADDDEEEDPTHDPSPEGEGGDGLPNFGWWDVFQATAEIGLFGPVEDFYPRPSVYQTPIHTLCQHLVRKRVEAERQKKAAAAHNRPATNDLD